MINELKEAVGTTGLSVAGAMTSSTAMEEMIRLNLVAEMTCLKAEQATTSWMEE